MGVIAGLLLGAGLLSVWSSFWVTAPRERATGRWALAVQDVLVHAGAGSVTPRGLVGASCALGVVVLLVGVAVLRSVPIAAAFAVMATAAPWALVRSRARRRRGQLREVWPEVVDHLASGVRAGLSLPEAVAQIGERGPVDLRPPFRAFARDYRSTGRFEESLVTLKARLADPVADRVIEALRITRDVGGTDLGRLLRTLSTFLREDLRTRGELEARQSWTVSGARLAAAGPWLVLALLATRTEASDAYNTPLGAAVIAGGAACSLVAYQLMLRIGRLPQDVRVLR
ncbi:type II secretion system F family protein [Sanguibacter suaedae]|uniref:Type II secretion system F family protein n=1 Tax=Sanguibacter suaedae TaxID=2795737 RepID=A0A934M789_9MICO|nr:type II secretion system F family protein [Sanguibacter suaedae]MBI9115122.1 type II secretion system F family protein [Sanguibacter suaedae]